MDPEVFDGMKIQIISLFVGICLLIILPAQAEQGCPDGFTPNAAGTPGMQCIPIGGQTRSTGPGTNSTPEPRWAKRWGAFTSDATTGKVGVATGLVSKRKAEEGAVQDCQVRGGSKCEVLLTFNNQCAAIASGLDSTGSTVVSAAGAPTTKEAGEIAVARCNGRADNCEIFITECSLAERVQ